MHVSLKVRGRRKKCVSHNTSVIYIFALITYEISPNFLIHIVLGHIYPVDSAEFLLNISKATQFSNKLP
jgi:hypothetical protein